MLMAIVGPITWTDGTRGHVVTAGVIAKGKMCAAPLAHPGDDGYREAGRLTSLQGESVSEGPRWALERFRDAVK